ncbi:MAG: ferrochelatase [Tahibacter sp.]
MPKGYHGLSNVDHAAQGRAAVVVVNLGTPDAPSTAAVRRYLDQFLSDPRVIEQPRWLWWLILHGIILRLRPARSARAYARIWTSEGSPLLVHSRALAAAMNARLRGQRAGPVTVELAMCYGNPGLPEVLLRLHDSGVRRLLILPLYPQYSATSTGAVIDAVADVMKTLRWPPELRIVNSYHDDAAYIEALAQSVEAHWRSHPRAQHLLLSFHGIPQRYFAAGDPYFCHCQGTARRLAERLQLKPDEIGVSFQSRVGREAWLQPYTDATLAALPGRGVASVQVLCPGFVVDCLETLEEIALENRDVFLHAGGDRYEYIPALNAQDTHVNMLTDLVLRHTQGWPEFSEHWSDASAETARAAPLAHYERIKHDA